MKPGAIHYETPKGAMILREHIEKVENDLAYSIPQALAAAAATGDRSENPDYDEAKRWQVEATEELATLKTYVNSMTLIDRRSSYEKVAISSFVEVLVDKSQRQIYCIVGRYESDASKGLMYYGSPLARVLLNRRQGDTVNYTAPNGVQHAIQIITIGYYEDRP